MSWLDLKRADSSSPFTTMVMELVAVGDQPRLYGGGTGGQRRPSPPHLVGWLLYGSVHRRKGWSHVTWTDPLVFFEAPGSCLGVPSGFQTSGTYYGCIT